MNSRMLVVGASYVENVIRTDGLPTDGAFSLGTQPEKRPAGRGGTAAVITSRLTGDDVILCSALGNDQNGRDLITFYHDNYINTTYVSFPEKQPTGVCTTLIENDHATVKRVLFKGASDRYSDTKVSSALLCAPDGVFLTTEVSDLLGAHVIASANAQGIPVFLDMAGLRRGSEIGTMGDIELLILSEDEATQLSGVRPSSVENALRCCISLRNRYKAHLFVLRLGRRGCFVYNGKYHYLFLPCSLESGNITGFVDFEAGAIAAEYLSSGSIKSACEIALVGTRMAREFEQMSIPTREQISIYCARKEIAIDL